MSEIEELSFSRRNFLRAARALGVSGVLLGAHVSQARGQEDKGGDVSSAGAEHRALLGKLHDRERGHLTVRPIRVLRNVYRGEERQDGGRTVRDYVCSETGLPAYSLLGSRL